MRYLFVSCYYELKRILRNRLSLLLLLGLPLLLIFLIGNGLQLADAKVRTVVYLADDGPLAASVRSYLEEQERLSVHYADSAAGVEQQMNRQNADYGVMIPAGFSRSVLAGESVQWTFYPGQLSTRNMTAEAVLSAYLDTLKQQLVLSSSAFSGQATALPHNEGSTEGVHITTLASNASELGTLSTLQYYSAAYMIMFLFYSSMGTIFRLLQERDQRTLHRLAAMPSPLGAVVAGKALGMLLFAAFQAVIVVLASHYLYGVDWGGDSLRLGVVIVLTIASAVALAVVVASLSKSAKTAETLYTLLVVVMTFVSGGMIADVGLLAAAGPFTINYWSSGSIRMLMSGDAAGAADMLGGLACITGVLLVLAFWRMRKVVSLT